MKKNIYPTRVIIITFFILISFLQSDELDILVGEPDISSFPDICFTVSVKDSSGLLIENLDTSMVRLYEDSVRNRNFQIQTLEELNDKIAILIAVDASLSMAGTPMDSVKSAIKTFVKNINDKTLVSLSTFHDKVEVISPFTTNRDSLLLLSDSIKAIGLNTELYEGLVKGLEYLNQNDKLPKSKAIIVLSDGKDEGTAYTDDDAIELALEYGIPIFTIGYHTKAEKKYLKVLDRISFKTGGIYNDAPTSMKINQIYNQVYEQIKSQQTICFTAEKFKADSLVHKINVNIVTEVGNGQAKVEFLSPNQKNKSKGQNYIFIFMIFGILFLFIFINKKNKTHSDAEKEKLRIEKENLENQLINEREQRLNSPPKEEDSVLENSDSDSSRNTTISQHIPDQSDKYHLKFHNGPLSGESILISDEMTIGRGDDNLITILEPAISGNHAKIIKKDTSYIILDMGSTNGTFVNGQKIDEIMLKHGDKIKIGKIDISVD